MSEELTVEQEQFRDAVIADAARAAQDVAGREVPEHFIHPGVPCRVPGCPGPQPVTPPPDALRTIREEVRKLGDLTPEDWDERRGGDPIARTINAVEDIISVVEGSVREAHVGSQLADPPAALSVPAPTLPALDAETLAWALWAWGFDAAGPVIRDAVKAPTEGQRRMARKLANEYNRRKREALRGA